MGFANRGAPMTGAPSGRRKKGAARV